MRMRKFYVYKYRQKAGGHNRTNKVKHHILMVNRNAVVVTVRTNSWSNLINVL